MPVGGTRPPFQDRQTAIAYVTASALLGMLKQQLGLVEEEKRGKEEWI
jgi:hypothetical protein